MQRFLASKNETPPPDPSELSGANLLNPHNFSRYYRLLTLSAAG
jgi:hypothetical protein